MSEEQFAGVMNPYALAELVIDRPIRWNEISEPKATLQSILQTPYEELFDAQYRTAPYAGVRLDDDFNPSRVADEEMADQIAGLHIPGAPVAADLQGFDLNPDRVRELLHNLLVSLPGATDTPWTPSNTDWVDKGDFFEEGTEAGDPQQGALGDCYLIAALGAVAWARPYVIAHRNRRTGVDEEAFVDMVEFHTNGQSDRIEVTERVPVTVGRRIFKYGRSTESGEIWPAIYEKAYAKWKTQTSTDQPKYPKISGGWPHVACRELIGGRERSLATRNTSASDLYDAVRSHSRQSRTFDPMVAWTYCSGAASPDRVTYGNSGIVGCHAYTVLGWAWDNGDRYILLRNPWSFHTPKQNILPGSAWTSHDISYFRPESLNKNGVFGLKIETFKKYFAALGWAA